MSAWLRRSLHTGALRRITQRHICHKEKEDHHEASIYRKQSFSRYDQAREWSNYQVKGAP